MSAQVEAGVFIGGSDESCAGLGTLSAGDDVNRLTAVDLAQREGGGNANSKHLAFARLHDRRRALEPGAGGVHELPGEEVGAVERAREDAIGLLLYVELFDLLVQGDAGLPGCVENGGAELAGVN